MRRVEILRAGRRWASFLVSSLIVWGLVALPPSGAVAAATGRKAAAAKEASGKSSVSFALEPDYHAFDIFPLTNAGEMIGVNTDYLSYLLFLPLYGYGVGQRFAIDSSRSIARPPVYSDAGGVPTVTISLKPWRWSDGSLVTSRDVQFWYDLVKANPSGWGGYVTGDFPDNVVSFKVLSPSSFQLVLTRQYNPTWFTYNELSQLIPLPQAVMDRTGATSPVGNYDLNPDGSLNVAGAQAVASYLESQGTDEATFATNPLWKVVDGPYRLQSFSSSGPVTLVANPEYSGVKPRIQTLVEEPFTSETAELDALESGSVDYGYVPPDATKLIPRIQSLGYQIQPWYTSLLAYITLNEHNPTLGPAFRQAYLRQALEMLIDQKTFISVVYHGYGVPGCGPVPLRPASSLITPYERSCPFSYNPARARRLLVEHGWKVVRNGVSTCTRPGAGADQCGAGVARGTRLAFTLLYPAGFAGEVATLQAIQSAFGSVGVKLSLRSATLTTVYITATPCTSTQPACSWTAAAIGFIYGPDYFPTGGELFTLGGGANPSNYSTATSERLVAATHNLPGLKNFYAYENYITAQVPLLWQPDVPYQISAVKDGLRGWSPQNMFQAITPQDWYWAGK
jgi:peptide/nickel transport system substrate-binding protein